MQVLHIIYLANAPKLFTHLKELFLSLKDKGVSSRVIAVEDRGDSELRQKFAEWMAGVPIRILEKKQGLDLSLIGRLRRVIKEHPGAIVHVHNHGALISGVTAARLCGRKVFISRHTRMDLPVSKWGYKLGHRIICSSEDLKRDLASKVALHENRVKVLYPGVKCPDWDESIREQARERLAKKYGLDPHKRWIGTIGRLLPEEDHATLLKAVRKSFRKELPADLIIVGEGPLKKNLVKMAEEFAIQDRVRFVIPVEDDREWLAAFDIFVLTSIRHARPLSILEAMASGTPVIATAIGSHPEFIEDRKTGTLVPCGFPERVDSALMRLNAIADLAHKTGQAARDSVGLKFSLTRMSADYEDIYKSCT